jgi:hypothetical protein
MDYKELFALLEGAYKAHGLLSFLSVLISILCFVFIYELIKAVISTGKLPAIFNRKHKRPLGSHAVFERLNSIIDYQIGNLKINCPLRNKVFKRILIVRFEIMRDLLKEEAARDFDEITQEQLGIIWKTFLARLENEWCEKTKLIGIPSVVVSKFYELRENIARAVDEITNNLCVRSGDTEETVSFIFDIIVSLETSSLFTAGAAINSLNGELSNVEFEGAKCMKCNDGKCIFKAEDDHEKENHS